MPKFSVNTIMQFGGATRRAGSVLEVTADQLAAEIAQGKHRNGKPNSGLLNHCSPADDETADLCKRLGIDANEEPAEMLPEEKAEKVKALQEGIKATGKSFDLRWGIARLEKELIKAKIETGE